MALGTAHVALTEADVFIPELWSNEVVAAFKKSLVMPALVKHMNHVGKKGDVIHVPKPIRGLPSAKVAETQTTLIDGTATELTFNIDQHFEYSRLIEDIAGIQALESMRKFYTDDAGYALARRVDWDLHLLGRSDTPTAVAVGDPVPGAEYGDAVIGGDGSTAWDETANANAGNATALLDAGIRTMIQTMDDADVPSMGRAFIIPPVEKKNLMGIARFTEQAFVGEGGDANTIRNGIVGNVYGIPVFVSTNCPVVDDTGTNSDERACLFLQEEGFVFIEQLGIRVQSQYKLEWLGDLFTADTIYGKGEMRPEAVIPFIVPA